jgi:hypothetical protein
MIAQPKMFIISDEGGSSDCTQFMCDDPIFKPFIGSGLGRANTPDCFSKGHFLYVVVICNGKSEEICIKVSVPQLWKRVLFIYT